MVPKWIPAVYIQTKIIYFSWNSKKKFLFCKHKNILHLIHLILNLRFQPGLGHFIWFSIWHALRNVPFWQLRYHSLVWKSLFEQFVSLNCFLTLFRILYELNFLQLQVGIASTVDSHFSAPDFFCNGVCKESMHYKFPCEENVQNHALAIFWFVLKSDSTKWIYPLSLLHPYKYCKLSVCQVDWNLFFFLLICTISCILLLDWCQLHWTTSIQTYCSSILLNTLFHLHDFGI